MQSKITIAVLGGGGRTGKHVVTQLLNQGYHVKLLLRRREDFELQHERIEVIQGDALSGESIGLLTKDCQAIVSTIGQRKDQPLVASRATSNVLSAIYKWHIQRYLLVAGINIDTPFDKKSAQTTAATEWMKLNFPLIQEDRQKAYKILSESKVNWTLVRVPMIDFEGQAGPVDVDLEDCRGNTISAINIADFLVTMLRDNTYYQKAPFISNV
jgi:putative NADH-flavin reductase